MDIIKYIGIPYDIKNSNCWHIVRDFCRNELGLMVPEYMFDVSSMTYHDQAEEIVSAVGDGKSGWVKTDILELGTVVTFNMLGRESHIGVCISDKEFLHNSQGKGSGIDRLNCGSWSHRIKGRFKWINS